MSAWNLPPGVSLSVRYINPYEIPEHDEDCPVLEDPDDGECVCEQREIDRYDDAMEARVDVMRDREDE